MMRLDYPKWEKPTLYETLYPREMHELTPELEKISETINDEAFEKPILELFETGVGRPTVPVRVYVRLMVLKASLALSFEDLYLAVSKMPMYKNFCRIPMEQRVPKATTLRRTKKKYDMCPQVNEQIAKIIVKILKS